MNESKAVVFREFLDVMLSKLTQKVNSINACLREIKLVHMHNFLYLTFSQNDSARNLVSVNPIDTGSLVMSVKHYVRVTAYLL